MSNIAKLASWDYRDLCFEHGGRMSFVDTVRERFSTTEVKASSSRRRFSELRRNRTVTSAAALEGRPQWSTQASTRTSTANGLFDLHPRRENDFSVLADERITGEQPVFMGTGSVQSIGDTDFFDEGPIINGEIPHEAPKENYLKPLEHSGEVSTVTIHGAKTAGEITGENKVIPLPLPSTSSPRRELFRKKKNVVAPSAETSVKENFIVSRAAKRKSAQDSGAIAELAKFISKNGSTVLNDGERFVASDNSFENLRMVLRKAGEEFNSALKGYVEDVENNRAVGEFDLITQLKLEMILLATDVSRKPLSELFPREIKSLQKRIEEFKIKINDFNENIGNFYSESDSRIEAQVWAQALTEVANAFDETVAPFSIEKQANKSDIDAGVINKIVATVFRASEIESGVRVNRPAVDRRDNVKSLYQYISENPTALALGYDLMNENNNWRSLRSYINKVRANLENESTKFDELKDIDKSMLKLLKYVADGPKQKGYRLEKISSDALTVIKRLDDFDHAHPWKNPSDANSMNREARERFDALEKTAHSVYRMATKGLLKDLNIAANNGLDIRDSVVVGDISTAMSLV